jgi:acyl-CoA synthetase (NDP forming)
MMADAAVGAGLSMPPPSDTLTQALRARLPAYAALANPIDMTANVIFDPAVMAGSLQDVAQSGEYDAALLCVNLIWRQGDALAEALARARAATDTMLAIAWIAALPAPLQRLAQAHVPVFGDPVRCVRALAARMQWNAQRSAALSRPLPAVNVQPAAPLRTYGDVQRLLVDAGIAVARGELVSDVDGARRVARELGYPVVAKLIAPSLPHKSDVGGVRVGLDSDELLARAVSDLLAIPCVDRQGVLVQQMIVDANAVELFAGFIRDAVFGPIVVFGLGGVFVEILRDVVMRPAPFDAETALQALRGARFHPVLAGARGRGACDVAAVAEALARLSTLAVAQPAIASLDINPLLASPAGAIAVDFKLEPAAADAPAMSGGVR